MCIVYFLLKVGLDFMKKVVFAIFKYTRTANTNAFLKTAGGFICTGCW